MDKNVKKRWVAALESGKFRQGIGQFAKSDKNKHVKYCCLGVLNKIENLGFAKDEGFFINLPFGITEEQQNMLVCMNDDQGCSFKEIAKYIRKNL